MRLLVFGATGGIGRLVVEKALGHGHDVTAFVHEKPLKTHHPRLASVTGDARDLDSVRAAVPEHDGVAFALSASSSGKGVHDAAIANIVYAMAESDVRRLSAVSAAGTFDRSSSLLPLSYRALVATVMRATYDDLEAMERRIMASDLDWTIVRPVGLTDEPPTGAYRVTLDGSLLAKSGRVSRADVAAVLVKALETDTYRRRAVVVGR